MRFAQPCPVVVKHNPIVKESTRQRSASIDARESSATSDLDGSELQLFRLCGGLCPRRWELGSRCYGERRYRYVWRGALWN
jgi:hypothetical protein